VQINAVKFRTSQNEDPITYKFSQSNGKFANFQCISGPSELLRNVSGAVEYALTGRTAVTIFDTVVQASDHAGNTWIVHRTPTKIRIVRNGTELPESDLSSLYAAFFEHLDGDESPAEAGRKFALNRKKVVSSNGRMVAMDPDGSEAPGADVRGVLEEQIATLTQACIEHTGLKDLADPGKLIRLTQVVEPIYASYREVCNQYKSFKEQKPEDPDAHVAEIAALELQLEIIRELEAVAEKYLGPNHLPGKTSDDIAAVDSQIAELKSALGLTEIGDKTIIRDFRKPVEAIARLEMFAKLVRSSQGARKYCEQKIEPLYKKYLEFADRNLASNRQIAAELESCLSTLALRLKVEAPQPRESGQSLKTWFEKFKSRAGQEEAAAAGGSAQNDFDTARLAIEYAVTQLNEMAGHLKVAVTRHDSALTSIDDAHEALVAQYNQLKEHWIATSRATGIPADIDSSQMIRIIVAHGRLAALLEKRNELVSARKQQESELMQIEDLVVRWRQLTGSQKSLDLSTPAIVIREARDILRYKDQRTRRLQQLRDSKATAGAGMAVLTHLKERRETLVAQWEQAFAEAGMDAPAINDKFNRELIKRAGLVRGLTLAWASTPGIDPGAAAFGRQTAQVGLSVYDCSALKLDHSARLDFLRAVEAAEGEELRLLLVSDDQLTSLIAALAIGTATRVVQAPAPAVSARPTPVAKIIRAPQKRPATPRHDAESLSERAQQMLDLLSPRK
jgi:hypothetical protein